MSIVGRQIVEPPETRMVLENVAWETVKRSDSSKAYEADESYYVTHAAIPDWPLMT